MWIAEGFVHEKEGISSFKIGEGYFHKLVKRSLIKLVCGLKSGNDDMIYGCEVHDMVLDLICSISSEEDFITRLLDGNKAGASSSLSSRLGQGKVRKLALQSDGTVKAHMEDMKQVRSFISRGYNIGGKGRIVLSSFKFVRLLVMHTSFDQCMTRRHLKAIQNLLHLRCLQLSCRFVDFPEKEIATLKFLQTLDVDTKEGSKQVALSVSLLTQLRCLRIRKPVVRVPYGIGKLSSLEELEIISDVYVKGREQDAWRGFINELGGLRELKVLRVRIVGMVLSLERAQEHMVRSLCNLHKLEHLALSVFPVIDADTKMWEEAEGGNFLLPRRLRQLFLPWIIFSLFPSFFLNASRLPILSHLSLAVLHLDAQDLRILSELPELCYLHLRVEFTVQLAHTDATDDACLFRKLRNCSLHWYGGVRLLSSEVDSGGVSIGLGLLEASMVLDSGRNKDVALTLLPSVQVLEFAMHVRDFKQDGNGSLNLEYFASLQHGKVSIKCDGASAAEVEQVEAALRSAADVHPNRPKLEVKKLGVEEMISENTQGLGVQQEVKSGGV